MNPNFVKPKKGFNEYGIALAYQRKLIAESKIPHQVFTIIDLENDV